MVLGADRLNVNDFSAGLAKAIQQSADVLDDRLQGRAVPFTAFGLHVDDDQAGVLRRKFDGRMGFHKTSKAIRYEAFYL
jgi:hypothetical protein